MKSKTKETFEVRDTPYQIDNEYIDNMARLCGWKGTIVYSSLCRHAEISPLEPLSVKAMAKEHGVEEDTILTGIKELEKRNVIAVDTKYTLLDKSKWETELDAAF